MRFLSHFLLLGKNVARRGGVIQNLLHKQGILTSRGFAGGVGVQQVGVVDEEESLTSEERMEESPTTSGGGSQSPRIKDYREENKVIIARILGVGVEEVRKPPKKLIPTETASQVYAILQEEGFGSGEILRYPDLFMMTPWSTSNYIQILQESLFNTIGLPQILNFNPLLKTRLELLESKRLAPSPPHILRNYFQVLSVAPQSPMEDAVWNALPLDVSKMTLKELREMVIVQYLAWQLNCDPSRVEPIIPKYSRISHRSLSWITQSLSILLKDTTLGPDKLLNHSYLLTACPTHLSTILREIPSLSTIPLSDLISRRPKILMSPPSALLEIESLFSSHSIPASTLLRHPELFTLAPSTIRARLTELETVPEFLPLKNHPRISRLIYYQTKARQRVDYFRSVNFTGASLHLLSMDKTKFRKHVAAGDVRNRGRDIISYIKTHFQGHGLPGTSAREIGSSLRRQPHWLSGNVVGVKETLRYLEVTNFSPSQILDALPLLLYPKEAVAKGVETVSREGDSSLPWFLHMVLYILEKETHFSGDGIWGDKGRAGDSQDIGESEKSLDKYLKEKEGTGTKIRPTPPTEGEEEVEEDEILFGDSLHETLNPPEAGSTKEQ